MDAALWRNVSRAPWFLARRLRRAGLEPNHGQAVVKLRSMSAAANSLAARSAAVEVSRRSMSDLSSLAGIAHVNSSSGRLVRVRLTAQPGLTATWPAWARGTITHCGLRLAGQDEIGDGTEQGHQRGR